jgi:hypothetical protein
MNWIRLAILPTGLWEWVSLEKLSFVPIPRFYCCHHGVDASPLAHPLPARLQNQSECTDEPPSADEFRIKLVARTKQLPDSEQDKLVFKISAVESRGLHAGIAVNCTHRLAPGITVIRTEKKCGMKDLY